MAVWRRSVSGVRTRRHHRFAKCSLCEMFRSEVAKCGAHESSAMEIMQQKREHLQIIAKERRSYYQRRDKAIANPKEFCSFIVDGADQKAYGLPHFAFHSKSDKGHALKVKCIGVLEHLLAKHVTLFTMTEEFPTGANHVVEAMHRVLNTKRLACGKLPPICYIQVDNCSRENKIVSFSPTLSCLLQPASSKRCKFHSCRWGILTKTSTRYSRELPTGCASAKPTPCPSFTDRWRTPSPQSHTPQKC